MTQQFELELPSSAPEAAAPTPAGGAAASAPAPGGSAIARPDEGAEDLADVHSHLVPGVDDGARDLAESLSALEALAAVDVRHVLTTPHIDASVIARAGAFERLQHAAEAAWRRVIDAWRERSAEPQLYLGREIMLDTPVPDVTDPRVRLNGGHYVLVEFPRLNIPPGSEDVLYRLRSDGFNPVVAHVERYHYYDDPIPLLDEWCTAGAVLQVNAPSLLGRYGAQARQIAWDLLERGWVGLIASDYHARGETCLPEARAALRERGGDEQERLLMRVNPRRIITDEPLEAAAPIPARAEGSERRWGLFRRRRARGE